MKRVILNIKIRQSGYRRLYYSDWVVIRELIHNFHTGDIDFIPVIGDIYLHKVDYLTDL